MLLRLPIHELPASRLRRLRGGDIRSMLTKRQKLPRILHSSVGESRFEVVGQWWVSSSIVSFTRSKVRRTHSSLNPAAAYRRIGFAVEEGSNSQLSRWLRGG